MSDAVIKDDLHTFLFEEGRELVDIKFMPGGDSCLTEADIRLEAAKGLREAMGKPHQPPNTGREKGSLKPIAI